MKYEDGNSLEVGDVFTDGSRGREDVRLKNRYKVLYVDKFTLVWFPLNEFTKHGHRWESRTYNPTYSPKKIELSELTEEELDMYHNSDYYLFEQIQ